MNFVDVLGGWVNRYFSRPDAIFLIAAILVLSLVLYTLAGALAPVLTGLILAFLLQGLVERLERFGSPRLLAIIVAMIILIGTVSTAVLLVVPLLWQQAADLLALAPSLIGMLRDALSSLSEAFPEFITEEQIRGVVNESSKELGNLSAFLARERIFPSIFVVRIADLSGLGADFGVFSAQRQRAFDDTYELFAAKGSTAFGYCGFGDERSTRQLRARQGDRDSSRRYGYLRHVFIFWS